MFEELTMNALTTQLFTKPHYFHNGALDIYHKLLMNPDWTVSKISRCANFKAHDIAKWAVTNHVFGYIPTSSHMISSIHTKSGKDPPPLGH